MNKEEYNNFLESYKLLNKIDGVSKIILLNLFSNIIPFVKINKKKSNNNSFSELLKEYEKKAYTINGKLLSDKEIINYELKKIKKVYNNKVKKIEFINNNSELELLVLIEYYMEQLKIFNEIPEKDLQNDKIELIKRRIAYMAAILNVKTSLYFETYMCLLEDLEKNMIKINYNQIYNTKELNDKLYNNYNIDNNIKKER